MRATAGRPLPARPSPPDSLRCRTDAGVRAGARQAARPPGRRRGNRAGTHGEHTVAGPHLSLPARPGVVGHAVTAGRISPVTDRRMPRSSSRPEEPEWLDATRVLLALATGRPMGAYNTVP